MRNSVTNRAEASPAHTIQRWMFASYMVGTGLTPALFTFKMFHVKHLSHDFASVDYQYLAGDKGSGWGSKEESRGDNIGWCSPTSKRNILLYFFPERF